MSGRPSTVDVVGHIHSSNRLEALVDALSKTLESPLSSPFMKETVLVPSRALGAWLSTELAKRHGVWANADFATPIGWIRRLANAAADAPDPFRPDSLAWSIAATLPTLLTDAAFEEVRRYLVDDGDGTKRMALAMRIARVVDRYVQYRPGLIEGWQAGKDDHWQAKLVRALVAKHGPTHLGARVDTLIASLRDRTCTHLPERLSLFCVGRHPPLFERVFDALESVVPMDTFAFEPATAVAPVRTVLAHVQDASAGGKGVGKAALDPEDRSVFAHACHSTTRECEVLRDQILDALQHDPSLEPRDVLVLCPDLGGYAAAIDSVFGADPKGPQHLPYRIADRVTGTTLPAVDALLALLDVATSRLTAPAVVDLLFREPIRARFGLTEPDVETIRTWVMESRIRWAADERHRRDVGQPALRQNTWRFGLDRLLLGYAAGEDGDETFGDVMPFGDVDASASTELGALAEFCEALFSLRDDLRGRSPVAAWCRCIRSALERFVTSSRQAEFQHQIVRDALDDLVDQAAHGGFIEDVPVTVVRDALAADLGERASGFVLGSGGLTFASLAPGRCVPARLVALLGMNDGDFPRAPGVLGFDLLAREPHEGDPSPRDDDRRVFVEALFAARDRLVVTFIGRSIKNDAERPPSVVISEMLDAIDAAFTWDGEPASKRLVVQHALHAFSPRYFRAQDDRLFSHTGLLAEAATAMTAPRRPVPAFLRGPVPASPGRGIEPVTVDALCQFYEHPVVAFVSRRIGVMLAHDLVPLEDREPFELVGLEKWAVQEKLVRRARAGDDVRTIPPAIRAAGELPLGTVGLIAYDGLHEPPAAMGRRIAEMLGDKAIAPLEVDVALAGGERLLGWLQSVAPKGQIIHRFAWARGKHELSAWIRHLAMLATGRRGNTFMLSRGNGEPTVQRFVAVRDPKKHLADLVALYRLGQRVPIPLFPDPASEYVAKLKDGGDSTKALGAAEKLYREGYDGAKNEYVAKVYAEANPLDPSFLLFGGGAGEPPSFVDVATRVLGPLLDHLADVS